MYQALYRKWRPTTFDEVTGQSHITETLKTQVATDRLSHAYLFTGTRGTGKTTCAKILARAVNCRNPVNGNPCNECPACRGILDGSVLDVLELDAASNNGVDQVRALRDEAVYAPAAVRKRVYIVDEVHMLSPAAFNALLKILEEPPAHLMFILATTELHKVPATILSRCQRFSFKRILPEDIIARLKFVAQAEQIDLTEDGAALLARLADGGMRDALSLLDQCIAQGGTVDRDRVTDTLGLAGNLKTAHIFNAIRKGDAATAVTRFGELYAAGKDVAAVLGELIGLSRDLLIRKTAPGAGLSLMAGGYDEATLNTLSKNMPPERLIAMLELLEQAVDDCKRSGSSRTVAEICLIRLCDPSLDGSNAGLAARIARLEAAVAQGTFLPAGRQQADESEEPENQEPVPPAEQTGQEPLQPAPAKAPKQTAPAGSGSDGQVRSAEAAGPGGQQVKWSNLADAIKGKVERPVGTFLKNPDNFIGELDGSILTLYCADGFSYDLVNKPEILQQLADAASAYIGAAVQVRLHKGMPVSPAPEEPAPQRRGSLEDIKRVIAEYQNR